jgi:hypothetical protein
VKGALDVRLHPGDQITAPSAIEIMILVFRIIIPKTRLPIVV